MGAHWGCIVRVPVAKSGSVAARAGGWRGRTTLGGRRWWQAPNPRPLHPPSPPTPTPAPCTPTKPQPHPQGANAPVRLAALPLCCTSPWSPTSAALLSSPTCGVGGGGALVGGLLWGVCCGWVQGRGLAKACAASSANTETPPQPLNLICKPHSPTLNPENPTPHLNALTPQPLPPTPTPTNPNPNPQPTWTTMTTETAALPTRSATTSSALTAASSDASHWRRTQRSAAESAVRGASGVRALRWWLGFHSGFNLWVYNRR